MSVLTSLEILNKRGVPVTTINAGQINNTISPLTLIGKGYAGSGKFINENYYHLLENFANNSPPANPVEGQTWYDTSEGLKVRTANNWVLLATGSTTDIMLTRLPTASNINFASSGSHNVYTSPTGARTVVSAAIIIPTSANISVENKAMVSLEISNDTGDVKDRFPLSGLNSVNKFFRVEMSGSQRIVNAGETVKLNVITPISGADTLVGNIFLLGTTF